MKNRHRRCTFLICLSLRAPEGCVAISLQKDEIAELVPNEVRNLAPSLLQLHLATSLAKTFFSMSIFLE
jgi:hypothetical protein